MIDLAHLKIGDKVHYQPEHFGDDEYENGIVKAFPRRAKNSVRVVYKCDGKWVNFRNYTSELTLLKDLKPGWRHD